MSGKFNIDRWVGQHLIEESAATAERLTIKETGPAASLAPAPKGSTRREITIIGAGWGSSGYYSREMLARDGPKAFPKGTHMYMNHPSLTEDMEQPERTVEKLAAVLTTDPVMVGNELKAEAEIYEHWSPMINAVASDIGVSIRAIGEAEPGEAEGRQGMIITALTEGVSVDFVTKAGAKGKVGMLLESAAEVGREIEEARNVADWFAARIHSRFTMVADDMFGEGYLTRDERIGLSKGIGEALDAFNLFVDNNLPQLKSRDPFADPEEEGVVEETATPAAETNKEAEMADDKQLAELQESVRKLEEKDEQREADLKEANDRAERAEDALLMERARNIVNEAIAAAEVEEGENALPELPERAIERVRKNALEGKLPMTDDDTPKLDGDRLKERLNKAWRKEAEYLSGASGNGQVTGMGESAETNPETPDGDELTEAQQNELIETFRSRGMSEEAAKAAARGR